MKVDLLGAKCLPSAASIDHAVVPFVGLPAASVHENAAPPQGCTSMPRCRLYQARSVTGSFALKKTPPMPVTLLMSISRVRPGRSVIGRNARRRWPIAARKQMMRNAFVCCNGQPDPMPSSSRATHVHVTELAPIVPREPAATLGSSHSQAQHARWGIAGEDRGGRVVATAQLTGGAFAAKPDGARRERNTVRGAAGGSDAIDDRIA